MTALKIHFGIQMTGGGHITRGRALGGELEKHDAEVSYLFSGGNPKKLYDADFFKHRSFCKGLTFSTHNGHISYVRSALRAKDLRSVWPEARGLDLKPYDVVISDYEPITVRAARLQWRETIGITHQNAFLYDIPGANDDFVLSSFIRNYAPVTKGIGIHWDRFGQPLIPPLIQRFEAAAESDPSKIVVYMDFEKAASLVKNLSPFKTHRFHVYTSEVKEITETGNCVLKPLSRETFPRDVRDCAGIISNAGFEGPSEWLHMGKKMLVKPLNGQPEQAANAAALVQLGYGDSMGSVDKKTIRKWLGKESTVQVRWPDVAAASAQWIVDGASHSRIQTLVDDLWRDVHPEEIAVPGY